MNDVSAVGLVAVVAFDAGNTLAVRRSEPFSLCYPSLTVAHVQAHLVEREIWAAAGPTPLKHEAAYFRTSVSLSLSSTIKYHRPSGQTGGPTATRSRRRLWESGSL